MSINMTLKFKISSSKMPLSRLKLLLISLVVILGQTKTIKCCADCNNTYIPPCNMKYPYGDEHQMNADVTHNDTNKVVCEDRKHNVPTYGRCPFPPENLDDMKLTDPYIHCPEFALAPAAGQIPVDVPLSSASALCRSCDVKLTPDGAAVTLKCIGCKDLPNLERPANLSDRELMYTTYYIEIANYTSVVVQGREHFNP